MKKILVWVALVALAFLMLRGCFGTSWNQRLTLVIETPQGEVSGSSVTKVSFSPRNKIILRDLDSSTLRLRGEAAMVEVLPGRWLFALLPDQERLIYTYVSDQQADGHIGLEEAIPLIQDQTDPLTLDPKSKNSLDLASRFPILATFDEITKPETVRQVDPEDLAAEFGEGVRLKAVTIEVTHDAVTEGEVEGVLGWLGRHPGPGPRLIPPDGRSTRAPFGMTVSHGDFVRRP
jgi:hypothetical protein